MFLQLENLLSYHLLCCISYCNHQGNFRIQFISDLNKKSDFYCYFIAYPLSASLTFDFFSLDNDFYFFRNIRVKYNINEIPSVVIIYRKGKILRNFVCTYSHAKIILKKNLTWLIDCFRRTFKATWNVIPFLQTNNYCKPICNM